MLDEFNSILKLYIQLSNIYSSIMPKKKNFEMEGKALTLKQFFKHCGTPPAHIRKISHISLYKRY